MIGVGEKIALERRCAGSDIGDERGIGLRHFQEIRRGAESGSLDGAGDVEYGEALRNDYGMEINIAAPETPLQVDDVRRLLEQIFSGLEPAAVVKIMPEDEGILAANDPGGLQFRGNTPRGISGVQQHKGFRRGFRGSQQSPGEPSPEGERCNNDEPEDFAHDGDSLDDERGARS